MDTYTTIHQPTIGEIEEYLTIYGWKYRKTTYANGAEVIIAPYSLDNDKKEGILITFSIAGEFVMVSTRDFMKGVPNLYSSYLLGLNDKIKLVKLFAVNEVLNLSDDLDLEVGFELWAEAWNKETFCVFMDCLGFAIDKAVRFADEKSIPYSKRWITFE